MKPEVLLKEEEKSKVVKVYRRYSRGKWYSSPIPLPGFNTISYKATKKRNALYHSDRAEAEKDAEDYNRRLQAYKKGRQPSIPENISWYDFNGTEVQNPLIWWHDSGSWLYAHGYDDWDTQELLEDLPFMERYEDYGHTTLDFFEVLLMTPRFSSFRVLEDEKGEWKIYSK